ncbi:hypothetical protein GQ53DRAFT_744011 [Thozetella sp. PMI_491]|nr:hypothetical protein GQ53DRAFT_744011 [Thozetella sp. PMI_491]
MTKMELIYPCAIHLEPQLASKRLAPSRWDTKATCSPLRSLSSTAAVFYQAVVSLKREISREVQFAADFEPKIAISEPQTVKPFTIRLLFQKVDFDGARQWISETLCWHLQWLVTAPRDLPYVDTGSGHKSTRQDKHEDSCRRISSSSSAAYLSHQSGWKRRKENEDDETGEGSGDGSNAHVKKDKITEIPSRQFACPYYKYNPSKYGAWRGCAGPGWATVHRVKEHLYRRHRQSRYRCERCSQSFENELELGYHVRAPEPCCLRPPEPTEGFDARQEMILKSRKRFSVKQSEAEKWQQVFKILFPDVTDDDLPSPFYDHQPPTALDSSKDLEEYLVREAPQRIHGALRLRLPWVDRELARATSESIPSILQEIIQEFRQGDTPAVLPKTRVQTDEGRTNDSTSWVDMMPVDFSPEAFGNVDYYSLWEPELRSLPENVWVDDSQGSSAESSCSVGKNVASEPGSGYPSVGNEGC